MEVEVETIKKKPNRIPRDKRRSEIKIALDGLNRLNKQKTISVNIKTVN